MAHYLFVTGRLAEEPLRRVLQPLSREAGFEYSVAVMPITIAALITPRWLARRLEVAGGITAVIVPGHCQGNLAVVEEAAGVPVLRGPRDLRELPEFFGRSGGPADYGEWDIEIVARLGSADEFSVDELLERAGDLCDDGADVVLLAGRGRRWPDLGPAIEELRGAGHRVALADVTPADLLSVVHLGAELVFPADEEQREVAASLGLETVVEARGMRDEELRQAIETGSRKGARVRIDPGLRPIGVGLAESVERFVRVRREWPQVPAVMGLDAVTETTAVDSAALHVVLMGICEELGVGSVVVSQDSNWTRTAVRECHLARQMSLHAAREKSPAGEVEPGMLLLRDVAAREFGREELDRLAQLLKDPSPRLFAEGGRLHAVSSGKHLESDDPYDLFDQIVSGSDRPPEAVRAFYLGYEMAKAMTALTLGKTYRQDEALDWGLLTQRELTRLERRALRLARLRDGECEEAREYFDDDGPVEADA
ncbi:MAG: DUF6513 domain-containing protein [Thermoguttaceae bacterium]